MKYIFAFISIIAVSLSLKAQQNHLDLILKIPGVLSAEIYVPETFESLPPAAVSGFRRKG